MTFLWSNRSKLYSSTAESRSRNDLLPRESNQQIGVIAVAIIVSVFLLGCTARITPNSVAKNTPTPVPQILTIDDAVIGTDINQFNYTGAGWAHNPNAQPTGSDYNNSLSYDTTGTDSVTYRFTGTRIQVYGTLDVNLGIASYSIDGGSTTSTDQYAATRQSQILLFDSKALAAGNHTLSIVITGTHNVSGSGSYVTIDFAKVTD